MKVKNLYPAVITVLMACNNGTSHDAQNTHSSDHAGHDNNMADTTNQHPANSIKAIMDHMMSSMHGTKATGNIDVDFATMMIEHHRAAVEMAQIEMEKGADTALKNFAHNVITDQDSEIKLMQNFLSAAPKTASPNPGAFQKALTNSMMVMMSDSTPVYNNIDKDFAAQMIPHHQSAVDMARAYLQHGKDKKLTTLCQDIITTQTKEISWLKAWLAGNRNP